MMVEEQIHKLLFDHDCVIIPDFGGLITHYASARVHPVKHTFSPPSKRIAFNEKLKLNDGLLISTLAYDNKLPAEEAQAQVTRYVQKMQEALQANQQYEMKGIGLFRYNQEQKLQFEYLPVENFSNHSFGLPEIISRPVPAPDVTESLRTFIKEKNTPVPAATPQKAWSRRLRRVYDSVAVMAIAGLSATALYVLSLQNDYSQSSLNPFTFFNQAVNNNQPKEDEGFYTEDFSASTEQDFEAPVAAPTPAIEVKTTEPGFTDNATPTEATLTGNVPAPASNAVVKENTSSVTATPAANTATIATNKNEITAKTVVPTETVGSKIATTIKTKTERYYVIAGGYSTLQNAQYSRKVANRHGAQGKVILPFAGSKLYRVSIADFGNKEEALAYLPQLKSKYGKNIWILNY